MRRRQGSRAVTSLTYTVVFSSLLLTLISQINVASVAASETQATNFPDPRGTQSLMYLSFITSIASIYVSVDHLIRSGLSLAVVHIFVDWYSSCFSIGRPSASSVCCVSERRMRSYSKITWSADANWRLNSICGTVASSVVPLVCAV